MTRRKARRWRVRNNWERRTARPISRAVLVSIGVAKRRGKLAHRYPWRAVARARRERLARMDWIDIMREAPSAVESVTRTRVIEGA